MTIRDTDSDWKVIAEENPYWGVLSQEQYKGKKLDKETLDDFFSSGELLINNILGFIRKHFNPEFYFVRTLDFGCGVGRLLIPLAKLSNQSVGLDVSENMLTIARNNAETYSVENVELLLSKDDFSNINGEFNFINTYIVLQHIAPERGINIIQNLFNLLEKNGIGSIQLTYCKSKKFWLNEINNSNFYSRRGEDIKELMIKQDRSSIKGTIKMYDYDLNEVFAQLSQVSGDKYFVLPTDHDGHMGLHIIFEKSI